MAEELTDYLAEHGVKVRYLHSEVDTVERVEIIRDLRLGEFDVLVGINLLREGLDLPEVSLVAILDADKEGFLRSGTSLIQTIGRAARNVSGQVHMYADTVTDSMRHAIDETNRRRAKQIAYNTERGLDPQPLRKRIADILDRVYTEADESESEVAVGGSGRNVSRGKTPEQGGGPRSSGLLAGREPASDRGHHRSRESEDRVFDCIREYQPAARCAERLQHRWIVRPFFHGALGQCVRIRAGIGRDAGGSLPHEHPQRDIVILRRFRAFDLAPTHGDAARARSERNGIGAVRAGTPCGLDQPGHEVGQLFRVRHVVHGNVRWSGRAV
jgi:hypothetical protein